MTDFWRNSGYHLLARGEDGYLRVSDDFLRAFLHRPEVHPVEESCPAELRLHAALLAEPRRPVAAREIAAMADADARGSYRLVLNFRDRLLAADTVEQCYAGLFRGEGGIDMPPLLIDHLVHVIARNMLDACDDGFQLRAGELLFREQMVRNIDGAVLLTDAETVELKREQVQGGQISLLQILHDPAALQPLELAVLSADNVGQYRARSERFDFALDLTFGRRGLQSLCRVLERWVGHFLKVEVDIEPLERIDDEQWSWHVGLDSAATALLNDLYQGREVDDDRRGDLLSLFRLSFREGTAMRADVAGRPVYLGLCVGRGDRLRLKPQNLLVNLPIAVAA